MGYGPATHRRVVLHALGETWEFETAPTHVKGVLVREPDTGDHVDAIAAGTIGVSKAITIETKRGERGFIKWEALDGAKDVQGAIYDMRGRQSLPIAGQKIVGGTISIATAPDLSSSYDDTLTITITGAKLDKCTRDDLIAGARTTGE